MGSTMHGVDSPNRLGEHAVVLGAGMAGLLAARVLSEFYDSVSVIERDRLPDYPCHRRGIPQGRHVHNFYSRGLQVLGELFPGLLEDLARAGAVVVDDGDLSHFYVRFGRYELKHSGKFADPAALAMYMASRPFMEFHLRRRVKALPNVTFLDGHDVAELVTTADIVNGVRIIRRYNGFPTTLDADLVVDAMGRAARTPAFLERLGYERPTEDRTVARYGYSSQQLSVLERIHRPAAGDVQPGWRQTRRPVACVRARHLDAGDRPAHRRRRAANGFRRDPGAGRAVSSPGDRRGAAPCPAPR